MSNNLITLWREALPPEMIPAYPTYQLKRAVGGEISYELGEKVGSVITAREKTTVPGELLRGSDLSFIADYTENIAYRYQVTQLADGDPDYQAFQRLLCKSSILYFINTFCYTYDPRLADNRLVPFVTYPFQDDVITWIVWMLHANISAVSDKSRDMGMTWCCVAVSAYLTLFYEGMGAFLMTMNETDVDDRTPNSLFGKVRILLGNLPEWMRGGWVERGQGVDSHMSITIPDSMANIKGILSKGTAGRSGRASIVFSDEFAFVEDSTSVLDSLSELSNCKLYLSSANGKGNEFYNMVSDPGTPKKTLHWRESNHPLKNEEWAARKKSMPDWSDERWASEQDINYEGSTTGRVFSKLVSAPGKAEDGTEIWCHLQDGDYFTYDPALDVYTFSDLGINDPTSILFAQIKQALPQYQGITKTMLVFFDEHEDRDLTVWETRYLINDKGYRYREHIVDVRTGGNRDHEGKTWMQRARMPNPGLMWSAKLEQYIDPGPPINATGKRNSEYAPIDVFRTLLETPGAIAINRHGCPNFIKAMQNWSFPIDRNTRKKVPGAPPNHDDWSHACKAACYGVDWLYGKGGREYEEKASSGRWNYPALRLNVR